MFGRIPEYDPRNENYPMRLAFEAAPTVIEPLFKWPIWSMFNRPLDQGQTGTCVGHGGKHWMLIAPVIQTRPSKYPTAIDLYKEACKRDAWPENDDGDLQAGTSVLALFKALKDLGLVGSYVHSTTVDEIRLYLKLYGPVVIGINWYSSMMETNAEGFCRITPNATVVGGHCICLRYWSKKYDAPVFPQSWGTNFGPVDKKTGLQTGYGILDPDDLRRLMGENGEATAGLEQKLVIK